MAIDHIHRTGPVLPKQYPVKLAAGVKVNDIEPGTLVAFETNSSVEGLVPVTAWVWDTNEATTSDNFAAKFAGVASGRSNKDVPTDHRDESILIAQDGEFEVKVVSASYPVGTLLKPLKDTGNALLNTLTTTTDKSTALFVVSETSVGSVTRVKAYILKTAPKRMNNTNA
jgi:hypothetical protein